jgi:predicted dehydrogenase
MTVSKAENRDRLRIACIGAGRMANLVHFPSLASFKDVQIVSLCDINDRRMNETATKYSIKSLYTNYQEMIEKEQPDGVYVIGPPHLMYDVIVWCLQNKQNVFMEKPFGLNWHQAQALAELAERHGVVTQVGHQRRSNPLLNEMRTRCLKKGSITHAVCEFYKYDMKPVYSASDHLHDDCSHSVDTIRWICGGEVTNVESHCRRIGTTDINWVMAYLRFDNGSAGVILNSWSSGRRVFRVEMHSPGIYADVELEGKAFLYESGDYKGIEYDAREVAGSDEFYIFGGFQKKSREFIDSLIKGMETVSSPFRDVVKTMEVVETIIAQSVLCADKNR